MIWSVFDASEEDRPRLALTLALMALAVLSFQDAAVKLVSPFTTLWQFQTLRGVFNLVFLVAFLYVNGRIGLLWPRNPGPVILRSAIMIATMICFFSGAPFLTLAEMGAGLYTYPIFMTILGGVILKERIGRWRLLAVVLAAAGAVLIIKPGSAGFQLAQLLPVGAGFFYAVNTIFLRTRCRGESSFTLAAWLALGFLVACGVGAVLVPALPLEAATREAWPFLLTVWPMVTLWVVAMALLASLCNVVGNVLIVKAYQSAELSWLAPFDYSYLILATLWGFVLFSDLPDALSVLGMVLIAAGGILTAYRAQRAKEA